MQLFAYIEEDMRQRITSGDDLPSPLTLAGIAAFYKVSITPVRRAVQELVASGHLKKGGHHGRLEVDKRRPGRRVRSQMQQPPAPTDWEEVLSAWVFDLSLAGRAVYLREEATAKKFNIGRTVVRTVFGRLAGRGLLEHIPNRGWRVCIIGIADASDYLIIREAMELQALELAKGRLDRNVLTQMVSGNPEETPGDARVDNTLHTYRVECAGNRFIQDFFERHGPCFATLFDQAAIDVAVMDQMAEQHRIILQALIEEDWDTARTALSEHIRTQKPILAAALAKRQTAPNPDSTEV